MSPDLDYSEAYRAGRRRSSRGRGRDGQTQKIDVTAQEEPGGSLAVETARRAASRPPRFAITAQFGTLASELMPPRPVDSGGDRGAGPIA